MTKNRSASVSIDYTTNGTGVYIPLGATSAARGVEVVQEGAARPRKKIDRRIENAVYGHIRAVRTLGKTALSMDEIAKALSISEGDVRTALAALRNRGVKVVRAIR